MQRTRRVVAVGTVVVASALLVPGAVASAGGDDRGGGHGRETTLQFDVEFSPFNLVDLAEPGLSAGDVIVFDDVLLQDGEQVGGMAGTCVLIDATPLANCTGVVTLDEQDTITFAFLNAPPPEKVFAITGGSGTYRTAQGDGLLVEFGDGTGALTLNVVSR
jgi:allene oxide cyclase-like protein